MINNPSSRWDASNKDTSKIDFLQQAWDSKLVQDAFDLWIKCMDIEPGMSILDVGCGIGSALQSIYDAVGSNGKVVGVDWSKDFVDVAKFKLQSIPLIDIEVGDAKNLAFPDNSFDVVRTERVLMHQENPNDVLKEMLRVAKPNGIISAIEPDLCSLKIDGNVDVNAINIMFQQFQHLINGVKQPSVGIELYRRLKEVGAQDRQVECIGNVIHDFDELYFCRFEEMAKLCISDGFLTEERVQEAITTLENACNNKDVLITINYYIAYGYK